MMHKEVGLKIPLNRILALLILDIISVVLAVYISILLRFDMSIAGTPTRYLEMATMLLIPNIAVALMFFTIWRLYKSVWQYASANEMINIAGAILSCSVAQIIISIIMGYRMPKSYYAFYAFVLFVEICIIRFSYRILRLVNVKRTNWLDSDKKIRTMIIGAGAAGNTIIKEIESSAYVNMKVVCVIDDDPQCHGRWLRGVQVVGDRTKIFEAVEKYGVDEIVIAIPTAPKSEISKIIEICKETGCKLRTLPGVFQLINGEVSISKLREVQIEDLLGREPIQVNTEEIFEYVKNKVVMVTGGGGSIGSELCRQIAEHKPKQLIIIDIYENSVYDIQQELVRKYPKLNLKVLIASVRNTNRMEQIFSAYRPNIVYHAAAHKHVPLMEDSPGEAIKNNVFGTYKTAMAADKFGVQKFVLISTDKAVNPTNIMGASKRICEMVIQMLNNRSATNFVAVRFGNVLGSNGSVIPLFKKQIAEGGPVTVTDPEIIRYFMTIPEAVSLVLQAGAYAAGGEIFVLNMGEPVKILDLAKTLIKLSGYRVGEDIEIKFTGLRPGEKMYEELLMDEEGLKKTLNKMIYVGSPIEFDEEEFSKQLDKLKEVTDGEPEMIKTYVKEIVSSYHFEDK